LTKYFAYCQGDILLTKDGNVPFGVETPIPLNPWNEVTTLHEGDLECRIIRLDRPVTDHPELQMLPLRKSFFILPKEDYRLAGKGAELLYWDQQTRFCGVCGSPLKWDTSISKKCPQCGKEWWPSLAIAIIVRVRKGDQILLVHAKNFRGNFYGLVAGFVETGETLEDCVRREVSEETHLQIQNIKYFGSQPWPFPCGLMVGFTADYESGEVKLQKEELGGGGWFSKDNLPALPDKASIARQLIDDWLSS